MKRQDKIAMQRALAEIAQRDIAAIERCSPMVRGVLSLAEAFTADDLDRIVGCEPGYGRKFLTILEKQRVVCENKGTYSRGEMFTFWRSEKLGRRFHKDDAMELPTVEEIIKRIRGKRESKRMNRVALSRASHVPLYLITRAEEHGRIRFRDGLALMKALGLRVEDVL